MKQDKDGSWHIKAGRVVREGLVEQHRDQLRGRLSLGGSTGFQTGSTFKAFTLATWLKEGKALNDVIDSDVGTLDNPDFTECNGRRLFGSGDLYKPQNSEPTEGGKMRVLDATANSVNTAFVASGAAGAVPDRGDGQEPRRPHGRSPRLQVQPDLPRRHPAVHQGDDARPVLDLTADDGDGVRDLRADGTYCPAFPVLSIKQSDGKTIPVKAPACKQDAIDPDIAHGVTYASSEFITNGTATDVNGMINAPVAGKTGTTDNSVDTWFVGYTHARATAVWVGDNPTVASGTLRKSLNRLHVIGGHDYGGQSIFGATIAAPIWAKIMQVAVPGSDTSDWPDPPSDMLGSSGSDVPDVTGKSISDAIGILSGAGFSPRVGSPVGSNVPAGRVASTSPGSGATANQGATVTIHPSNGNGGGPTPAKKPTPPKKKKRHGRRRGSDARRQPASWRRTSAATRAPSARPLVLGWTAFMTRPIAAGPVPPRPAPPRRRPRRSPRAPRRTAAAGR